MLQMEKMKLLEYKRGTEDAPLQKKKIFYGTDNKRGKQAQYLPSKYKKPA
jgi:hypothetical protein